VGLIALSRAPRLSETRRSPLRPGRHKGAVCTRWSNVINVEHILESEVIHSFKMRCDYYWPSENRLCQVIDRITDPTRRQTPLPAFQASTVPGCAAVFIIQATKKKNLPLAISSYFTHAMHRKPVHLLWPPSFQADSQGKLTRDHPPKHPNGPTCHFLASSNSFGLCSRCRQRGVVTQSFGSARLQLHARHEPRPKLQLHRCNILRAKLHNLRYHWKHAWFLASLVLPLRAWGVSLGRA